MPSVNSTLTRNSRSTTVDSRQDVGLPNVHGSFNSLQNSILSEYTIHPLSYQFACTAQHGHRIRFPFAEWIGNSLALICELCKSCWFQCFSNGIFLVSFSFLFRPSVSVSLCFAFLHFRNANQKGQQPLLQNGLNVDLRYRATPATYANPFLRTSNASLPPIPPSTAIHTANPSATPAPPPYNATRNTATTSGVLTSSTSSTTSIKASPLTSSSPSGQFILPANGHLKKGALATHV